jgi:hypothetical protein
MFGDIFKDLDIKDEYLRLLSPPRSRKMFQLNWLQQEGRPKMNTVAAMNTYIVAVMNTWIVTVAARERVHIVIMKLVWVIDTWISHVQPAK